MGKLILTRRESETVVMSRGGTRLGSLWVSAIVIREGDAPRVKIGFDFADDIVIDRAEVAKAKASKEGAGAS